jgi:hypothetical protein
LTSWISIEKPLAAAWLPPKGFGYIRISYGFAPFDPDVSDVIEPAPDQAAAFETPIRSDARR